MENKILNLKKYGYIKDEHLLNLNIELLKAKDMETFLHSLRVARYSELIAIEMGYDKVFTDGIYISGVFHDIGKLLVPKYILTNQDSLTKREREIINRHAYDSYDISVNFISEYLSKAVLEHHERLNGLGYPFNEKFITIAGQIVAVADTFDAMTSQRSYQKSMDFKDAIFSLEKMANKNVYNKEVVLILKNIILDKGEVW